MDSENNRELIGHVGVDAGCIQIGDPCYTHEESGDWSEYCSKYLTKLSDKKKGKNTPLKNFVQIPYDMGHEGKAIIVSSGYGDGNYPVTVTRNAGGRIIDVLVSFIDDEKCEPYED